MGRGAQTHTQNLEHTHIQFMHSSQQLILAKSSHIITVGTSGYLFSRENIARQLETEKERKSSKHIQYKICCKTYKGQATILYMACLAEK